MGAETDAPEAGGAGALAPVAWKQHRGRRWYFPSWLAGAGLLLVAPKCLLCLVTYAGLGSGFVAAAREVCGADETGSGSALTVAVAMGGLALVIAAVFALWHRQGVVRKDRGRSLQR